MKRWLLWFSVPVVAFVLAVLVAYFGFAATDASGGMLMLFLGGWLWLTVIAVPVAIVKWLVFGGRAKRPAVD